MKLDALLLGTETQPLDLISGYDWLHSIDRGTFNPTNYTGTALLLDVVGKHASKFESGGYIADFEGLVVPVLEKSSFSNPQHLNDFGTMVRVAASRAIPGLKHLDDSADLSLVLSVYGKLFKRLPEHAKPIHQKRDGAEAELFGRPSMIARIKEKFSAGAEGITSCDTASAALDTVKAYMEAVNRGELEMTAERAMNIKWAMLSIKAELLDASDRPGANEIIEKIDDTMVEFETLKPVFEQAAAKPAI